MSGQTPSLSKWVSIKDRLPEVGIPVLVFGVEKDEEPEPWFAVASYNPKYGRPDWPYGYWATEYVTSLEDCCLPGITGPTHWMPLPEQPVG